jgi:hypothetical protein
LLKIEKILILIIIQYIFLPKLLRNNVYFSIEAENVEFNYLRKKSVLKIKFNKDLKQGEYECHAIYGGRTEISRFMVYVDKSSTSVSGIKILFRMKIT